MSAYPIDYFQTTNYGLVFTAMKEIKPKKEGCYMTKSKNWLVGMLVAMLAVFTLVVGQANQARAAATNSGNNKPLIIYFSMTGNTKTAAGQIQRDTGADIVRLHRATAYPSDYDRLTRVANRERKNNIHPAIRRNIPNLKQYNTVLIGFPTWWARPPMVIHTLFDDYNFSGKTIIPFTTSDSTPMSASMPTMRRLAKADHAKIKNGFRYDDNNRALRRFLQKNGLTNNN